MTSTTNPRTTRGTGYASPGAVSQHGGNLPVYTCNACGADVVWVDSKRTGRKYLVTVQRGYLDQRFYRGDNIHPRNCREIRDAAIAETDAIDRKARAGERFSRNMKAAMALHRDGKITTDQYLADLDMYEREYNEEIA